MLISDGREPPAGLRGMLDDTGCEVQSIERRFNAVNDRLTSTYEQTWSAPKGVEPPPSLVHDAPH